MDVNETDFWCFNVLADDITDFWHKVEEILMEEDSFTMRWPEKFEGNLLQLQNRYKEKLTKQSAAIKIVRMNGGAS